MSENKEQVQEPKVITKELIEKAWINFKNRPDHEQKEVLARLAMGKPLAPDPPPAVVTLMKELRAFALETEVMMRAQQRYFKSHQKDDQLAAMKLETEMRARIKEVLQQTEPSIQTKSLVNERVFFDHTRVPYSSILHCSFYYYLFCHNSRWDEAA